MSVKEFELTSGMLNRSRESGLERFRGGLLYFIKKLIGEYKPTKKCLVSHDESFINYSLFHPADIYNKATKTNKKYDLVFCDYPNPNRDEKRHHTFSYDLTFSRSSHFAEKLLTDKSILVMICYESMAKRFEKENLAGFNLEAVLEICAVYPHAHRHDDQFVINIFSKRQNSEIYVGSIYDEKTLFDVTQNFLKKKKSSSIYSGIRLERKSFIHVAHLRHVEEINKYQKELPNYIEYNLGDLIVEKTTTNSKDGFKNKKNTIYIKKSGNINSSNEVYDHLYFVMDENHKYFQVTLDPKKILASYLLIYLESIYGQFVLRLNHFEVDFKIENLKIFCPSVKEQEELIKNYNKFITLKREINKIERKLSITSYDNSTINKLNQLIDIVGELDEADKLKMQIRAGENLTCEFKETFNLDLKTNQKSEANYLISESFKTIVGFCNVNGGTLIYGVNDKSLDIVGVNKELEQFHNNNKDNFKKYFSEFLKRKIDIKFNEFIQYRFVEIDEKFLFVVDCERVPPPGTVFLLNERGEDRCYRRGDPFTEEVRGKQLADFIESRVKDN